MTSAGPPRAKHGRAGSEVRPGAGDRVRMTGKERREQLLEVGRTLFARKGFDATSVEEIA